MSDVSMNEDGMNESKQQRWFDARLPLLRTGVSKQGRQRPA